MVDEVLAATSRGIRDQVARLTLRSDEQYPSARRRDFANRGQRRIKHRHRLLQVDDVDSVPDAEDVRRHLGVPALRVVAEMDAGLQQLAHGELGHCHDRFSLSGFPSAGVRRRKRCGRFLRRPDGRRSRLPVPACVLRSAVVINPPGPVRKRNRGRRRAAPPQISLISPTPASAPSAGKPSAGTL